jgi:uncharacterized protein YndB with AHSA1/START domain
MPRLRLLPAALALLACAAPAFATTVVPMDTRALVARSHDIVIAEVAEVRSRWTADRSSIVTDVTLRVTETLKGAAAAELVLTQPGGEVEGFRYSIEGSPRFVPGEETLLFAWRDRGGVPQVSGLAQGKFEIRRDPATGARAVRRTLPGFTTRDVMLSRAGRTGGVPLEDMVGEIRRLIAEDGR